MYPCADPILVVGAGPSALVLALSLVQNGIPVRIVEKELKKKVGQRGASIIPRSLELFKFLRVSHKLEHEGMYPLPCRMYQLPEGIKPLHTFEMTPWQEPTPARPYLNMIQLGQDNLEKILRDELAKSSCLVEWGTELRSFEQFKDHVAANMVRTTESGKEISETARFSYVGGTDGARGMVRKHLGLTFLGETRNFENLIVGDIRIMGLDKSHWHMWGNPSTVLVSLRPTEDREDTIFNFAIVGKNIDYAQVCSSRCELVKCIVAATGRSDLGFGELVWLSNYRPNIRMVDKFGVGRVFVAGGVYSQLLWFGHLSDCVSALDSAHVSSPTGGQGMNVGIQDSFNLGWKLALVHKGIASSSLLDSYQAERYPVIARMVAATAAMLDTRIPAEADDDSSSTSRSDNIHQLNINYRGSPILLDETPTTGTVIDSWIRAGDRAPSASGLVYFLKSSSSTRRVISLFEIFDATRHTILVFTDTLTKAAPIVAEINQYHPLPLISTIALVFPLGKVLSAEPVDDIIDYVLEDHNGFAYEAYAVDQGETGIVVVRPDGVVGAIAFGKDGLRKYFDRILKGKAPLQRALRTDDAS